MARLSFFKHASLNLSNEQHFIRLLEVLPHAEEQLSFRLHNNIPLAEGTEFVALSYEWGPGPAHDRIVIDNKPFLVRRNLYDFLQQYKTECWRQWLWIDAICIDQANTSERNHQVSQMKAVYAKARTVLVWLGSRTAEGELVLGGIDELQMAAEVAGSWQLKSIGSMTPSYIRETFPGSPGFIQAITQLATLRYWKRAWIIQEVLLARCCTILCGEVFIPWELWTFALQIAGASVAQSRLNDTSAMSLVQLWSTKHFDARNILDLLAKFASSETTLPHDKIYALLGLTDEGDRIPVDYGQSMAAVLLDCLRASGWTVNDNRLFDACRILEIHIQELYLAIELKISETKLPINDWDVLRQKLDRNSIRLHQLLRSLCAADSRRQWTNLRQSQYVTGFRTEVPDSFRPSRVQFCMCISCITTWTHSCTPKMQIDHSRYAWVIETRKAPVLPSPFRGNTIKNQADYISLRQLDIEGQVGAYLASAIFPARLNPSSEAVCMLLYHDPNYHRDCIDIEPDRSDARRWAKGHTDVQNLLLCDHIFWWHQAKTRAADLEKSVRANLAFYTSLDLVLSSEPQVYDLRKTRGSSVRASAQRESSSDSDA